MGFSSWTTADTGESIMNSYCAKPSGTVYMLSPDGRHVREDSYEGYCRFGGMSAFEHLARMNLPAERLAGLSDDEVDDLGCELDTPHLVLISDGTKHRVCARDAGIRPGVTYHQVSYGDPIDAFGGRCANDLIASGELVEELDAPTYPLKFSFDHNADYASIPASGNCPVQGFDWPGGNEE